MKSTNLVIEPAFRLEVLEELAVRLASPEVQIRDFEVTPDYTGPLSWLERTRTDGMTRTMAHIVTSPFIVREESQSVFGVEVMRILIHELCHALSYSATSDVKRMVRTLPLTASHKVSTVCGHSYNEIVNPCNVGCKNGDVS